MTLRFGVIGSPIAHSRSPLMHEAAFRALEIDATYERFRVEPAELSTFVSHLARDGFRGVNVTLPHKSAVIAGLDDVSSTAIASGAVNTITVEGTRLLGDNTDAPGLVRALVEAGFDASGSCVVVLGAGGAARASVVGLSEAGARRITIAARRPDASAKLAIDLGPHTTTRLASCGMDGALASAFTSANLLVQATSATLEGAPDARRFADALPLDRLPLDALVTDVVYTPRTTTVLAAAAALGLPIADGLGMLVHQGALAFERWTGQPAPIDAMRGAL